MKLIIAGSRSFNDFNLLESKTNNFINKINKNREEIIIISGTARGADKLGEKYARKYGYKIQKYPAQWKKYGRSAGYKRNRQMCKIADAAIIFWNGTSPGSNHTINLAKRKSLLLKVVKY